MWTPNIQIFVDIVTKILMCFLDERNKTSRRIGYSDFDIEISRGEDSYFIRVTNCGRTEGNLRDIAYRCFNEWLNLVPLEFYIETIEFLMKEEDQTEEQVHKLECTDNEIKTSSVIMQRQSKHFAHLKKYLALRLKCKISSSSIQVFNKSMIDELKKLDYYVANMKCIFRSGDNIFWRTNVEVDWAIENCRVVSTAITMMINNSHNKLFKEQCLMLLGVNDTSETEDAVTNDIVSLIHKKYQDKKTTSGMMINKSRRKRTRSN